MNKLHQLVYFCRVYVHNIKLNGLLIYDLLKLRIVFYWLTGDYCVYGFFDRFDGTMNHSLGWRPSTVTCSLTPSNSLCINASNVEGVHIISSKAVGLMYDRQSDDTIVSSNFVSVDFRKMRTDSFQKIRTTRFRKIRVVR